MVQNCEIATLPLASPHEPALNNPPTGPLEHAQRRRHELQDLCNKVKKGIHSGKAPNMKKVFITILLFLPFLSFAQLNNLKGNVKSVREKLIFLDSTRQNLKLFSTEGDYGHYGFSSPEFTLSRFDLWWFHTPFVHYVNYLRNYDTQNHLLDETWYHKNDEVLEKYVYEYDKKGHLIQKKIIIDDSTFVCTSYNYDYADLLSTLISYSSFRPIRFEYEEHIYDDGKRLTQERRFDQDGETYSTKYTYTSFGKLKEKIAHSPYVWIQTDEKSLRQKRMENGSDQLQEERTYDNRDNLIKVESYIDNYDFKHPGKVVLNNSTSYRYDSLNRVIGEYYAQSNNTITSFKEYKYNENNLLSRQTFIRSKTNEILEDAQYFYNADRNIEKLIYTGQGQKSTSTFTYKFDRKSNWVEQLKSVDGKPLFLRKRELVYY